MSRYFLSAVVVSSVVSLWALPAHAIFNTWTNPVTGSWTDATKWTGGVPTATDSATFDKAGTYTVNFSNVFQSLTDMSISAGTVTFERLASPATLTIINANGGMNLTIGGATLNMGQALPVNITVGDDTIINSGGTLNVRANSLLNNSGFDVLVNGGGTLAISGGGDAIISKVAAIGSTTSSVGTVTVTGVGSTLMVGGGGGGIAVGGSGNGALTIQSGGQAVGSNDIIGSLAVATGTATVTGTGSSWNSSGLLTVGYSGTGTLRIENGAIATSGGGLIGSQVASNGGVTVTGLGSAWTVGGNLPVGNLGTGALTISNSGTVNVGGGAGQVSINALSTLTVGEGGAAGILQAGTIVNNGVLSFDHSDATMIDAPISGDGQIAKVDGAGNTTLANVSAFTGSFSVQGGMMILQGNANGRNYLAAANGTLRFASGTVNLGTNSIQAAAGGAVEFDSASVRGGYLRGPGTQTILTGASQTTLNSVTTFNSTNLVQNGTALLVNFTNGGILTNNAPLTFGGGVNAISGVINVNSTLGTYDVANSGVMTVNSGGAINNGISNLVDGGGSRTTINSGGAINLLGGTTLELNGALLVNNGTVTGTVNVNYGSLAKGTGNFDVVNVNEGGDYSPGNSPGISTAASVAFKSGSFSSGAPRLVMELGGTMPGTQYDQLHVTGALTLGGTLDVELVDLGAGRFAPNAGNSFDILDWGSLSGTFSSLNLPTLAGLVWNTSQLYATGVLSVASAGLVGDYNGNGVVDAADYTVWRNNLGAAAGTLPNDVDGGVIGLAQYTTWKAHFGQPPGGGSASNVEVPEPRVITLLATAVLMSGFCRRLRGD